MAPENFYLADLVGTRYDPVADPGLVNYCTGDHIVPSGATNECVLRFVVPPSLARGRVWFDDSTYRHAEEFNFIER
jgi:hypothetical protein